jgi:hypothetical protein
MSVVMNDSSIMQNISHLTLLPLPLSLQWSKRSVVDPSRVMQCAGILYPAYSPSPFFLLMLRCNALLCSLFFILLNAQYTVLSTMLTDFTVWSCSKVQLHLKRSNSLLNCQCTISGQADNHTVENAS